jgi:hypothetical protein
VIKKFDAQICHLASAARLAHQVITDTTPKGFTCLQPLITLSNGNVATTLMNAAKASLVVAQTQNASTPMEATSVHVQEVLLEIPPLDVFKCQECVPMAPYAIEMLHVHMLEATALGIYLHKSFSATQFDLNQFSI